MGEERNKRTREHIEDEAAKVAKPQERYGDAEEESDGEDESSDGGWVCASL